jgi:hypothetical protein
VGAWPQAEIRKRRKSNLGDVRRLRIFTTEDTEDTEVGKEGDFRIEVPNYSFLLRLCVLCVLCGETPAFVVDVG